MNADMPTVSNFYYNNTTPEWQVIGGTGNAGPGAACMMVSADPLAAMRQFQQEFQQETDDREKLAAFQRFQRMHRNSRARGDAAAITAAALDNWQEITNESEIMATQRRIVKVLIADINENVPMTEAVLHKGEEKFTDATDQELFLETPVKELLDAHNKKRVTWLDRDASKRAGKDIFLDAVKIRDLRMVVVTIAAF
jgi:hypothetical protein